MKTGIKVVSYEGVIPQSGKSVIEFSGHKLCHRSIKKDKSDLLVHIDTCAILRSYPIGTDRSIVLDDIANNVSLLQNLIDEPESYSIVNRSDVLSEDIKEPESILKLVSLPHSISHLDIDSKVMEKTKKSFNVGNAKW